MKELFNRLSQDRERNL
jgi:hypothetical protein